MTQHVRHDVALRVAAYRHFFNPVAVDDVAARGEGRIYTDILIAGLLVVRLPGGDLYEPEPRKQHREHRHEYEDHPGEPPTESHSNDSLRLRSPNTSVTSGRIPMASARLYTGIKTILRNTFGSRKLASPKSVPITTINTTPSRVSKSTALPVATTLMSNRSLVRTVE